MKLSSHDLEIKKAATRKTVIRLTSLVVLLLVAEYFGRKSDPILFAPPSGILAAFWKLLTTGVLLKALGNSLLTLLLGFIFGAVPGIIMGLFMGRYKLIDRIFSPYVYSLYAHAPSRSCPPGHHLVRHRHLWKGIICGPLGDLPHPGQYFHGCPASGRRPAGGRPFIRSQRG